MEEDGVDIRKNSCGVKTGMSGSGGSLVIPMSWVTSPVIAVSWVGHSHTAQGMRGGQDNTVCSPLLGTWD